MVAVQLKPNNLYRDGWVEVFDNNEKLLLRKTLGIKVTLTDKYHLLRRGEMLDALAFKYYQNVTKDPSKFWWVIADVNGIDNPFDLKAFEGTQIVIPNLIKAGLRL
jgi:hypothetical protein